MMTNLQSSDIVNTGNDTHCIIENTDTESSEDWNKASNITPENVDRLKPRDAGMEVQAVAPENVDEPLEVVIEAENTEDNPQLSGKTTHEYTHDNGREEQINLQINERANEIGLQPPENTSTNENIDKDAEIHLANETTNGSVVTSENKEDDEINQQEVAPRTQINELEAELHLPVSPETYLVRKNNQSSDLSENPNDDQSTQARMMNDAISLGRSLLKTSLGVASTIFTGIGKVMSTAAKIVGEENGKSTGNTTTNIQSTVNILVLQKCGSGKELQCKE